MDINGDCPFYDNYLENIDHRLIKCPFVIKVRPTITGFYPIPTKGNNYFVDSIESILKCGSVSIGLHDKQYNRFLNTVY